MTEVSGKRASAVESRGASVTVALPPTLVEGQLWAASSRLRAQRVLGRQRLRRRIVPPLVVGSSVLLGSGLSAAWVNGSLPAPAASGQSTSLAAGGDGQVQAIERVRQTMVADSKMITSLSKAARQAVVASQKTTVVKEAGSGSSAAGSSGSADYSVPANSGGGGGVVVPALPALPPMPSISIPTTQGSTGASHVVP